jgi:AraC family transcriptional regulator, transcriptional activator FtrA
MQLKRRDISVDNRFGRKLLRGFLLTLALVLLPIAAGIGTVAYKVGQIVDDSRPALVSPLPPVPAPDPSKLTAVVLLSNNGTEISDTLPPYELLAASGAFNTYFIAPERRVSPITTAQNLPFGVGALPSGLDILPHYSYADYDRVIGRDPDLLVIPYLTKFVPGGERPILDWIRAHAGPQTTILSICAGSRVLVETGLLDSRTATGLHQDLAGFRQRYPQVQWQSGVRWVDDGNIITSGTLTTGIDATLHTIERLVGRDVAERTGQALGYRHLDRLDNPAAGYQPPVSPDLGLLPHAMYSWGQNDVGVALHEGVSETALAALLDTAALNLTRSYTLASERTFVRSRHGMIMAPRFNYADTLALDRMIVLSDPADPGAVSVAEHWNQQRSQPHAELLTSGAGAGYAYDVVIADVAGYAGEAVARSDSVNLVYPVDPAIVSGSAWTPILIFHPLSVGLLGVALIAFLFVRHTRTQPIGQNV